MRGAAVLNRRQAGSGNWPKCAICRREVDAYGLENETEHTVEVWARCTGIRIDPTTGMAVHGAPRMHEEKKDSVRIHIPSRHSLLFKATTSKEAWSLTEAIARLAFFAPVATRDVVKDYSAESVHERD